MRAPPNAVLRDRLTKFIQWRPSVEVKLKNFSVKAVDVVYKCFNPACSVPFLYMHEGRLFRLEKRAGSTLIRTQEAEPPSRVEFFWLCDCCSRTMSVSVSGGRGVLVQKLAFAHEAAS